MLALTRKKGEIIALKINTGEGRIAVKVLDLGGGKVRLGIDAPNSVRILRGEIETDQQDASATESAGEGAATTAA